MFRVRVWKTYKVVSYFVKPMVEAHIEIVVVISVLVFGTVLGATIRVCMGEW